MRTAAVTLLLLLAAPASAFAHATVEATSPERGAALRSAPAQVSFRFDEPVEGSFGAVRVFDARGRRVDAGRTVHPGGRGAVVATGLRRGLPGGSYTATYRVVSADSHVVSGGFVFTVGPPGAGAAPGETVGDLLGRAQAGPVTEAAAGVARGVTYLAIALLAGGVVLLLAVWPRAPVRRLLVAAAAAGVVAGVAGIVLQGATAGGTTFWGALDAGVVRDVLHTRFGTVWALRAGVFALLAILLAVRARPAWLAVPAAFLVVSPALAGHASTQSPRALLVPLDIAHVTAMSAWVGGLVLLLAALPRVTRTLQAGERTTLLATVLGRFSPLALAAVAVLLATGVGQAIVHLDRFGDLLHTAFGRAVLIKALLLLGLIALGALNRQRTLPQLDALATGGAAPGAPGRVIRRTLRAEVALMVAALGVTAALVSYPPPSAIATGPYSASKRMGPLQLELTVDPARTGANAVHLYVFRARDGAPFAGTKELRVSATLPSKGIGPLDATVRRAGAGHYVADALTLTPGGTWRLDIADRVSDFDEYSTRIEVPIR